MAISAAQLTSLDITTNPDDLIQLQTIAARWNVRELVITFTYDARIKGDNLIAGAIIIEDMLNTAKSYFEGFIHPQPSSMEVDSILTKAPDVIKSFFESVNVEIIPTLAGGYQLRFGA